MPVTLVSVPFDLADRGGDRVVAQLDERGVRARVGAVARKRDRDDRDVLVRADDRVRGAGRGRLELVDALLHGGRGDVVGLDDRERRQRATRERGLDALVGLHDRQVVRETRGAWVDRLHVQGGQGEDDQQPAGQDDREHRPRERAVDHPGPDARLAVVAVTQTADVRHAALLDVVAQLGEDGGQDGDAADHRDCDDEHRADGEGREDGVAGQEHARHRDQHGQAGDEHGLARRRGGELERGLTAAPGVALLHFSPQVEHRIVDADGEADQQDHRVRRGLHRDDLADRADQSERPDHGRDGEQQRDTRRDERAEGDDQDDHRDRERQELGPLEVIVEAGAELLVGACVAELLDPQVGVRLLGRRGGGERGVDPLVGLIAVARDREGDERGAAILGDLALVALGERARDLGGVRRVLQAADDGLHARLERGVVDRRGLAAARLNEDLLVGLVGEVRPADCGVGDARGAVAGVLVGERVRPDRAAQDERDHDEREPAADRDLAVPCAPISGARGEVSLRHLRPPRGIALHVPRRLPMKGRRVIRAPRPVGLGCPTGVPVGLAIGVRSENEDQQQDDDDYEGSYTDVHGARPTPLSPSLLPPAQFGLTSSLGSTLSR